LTVLVALSLSSDVAVAIERSSRTVGTLHASLTVYTLLIFVVTLPTSRQLPIRLSVILLLLQRVSTWY